MVGTAKKTIAYCFYFIVQAIKTVFFMTPGSCRFSPTCSEYAKEAIEKLPVHTAIPMVIRRLFRCHPLCAGGYDPIPEAPALRKGHE
jgi:uncharacterized protein